MKLDIPYYIRQVLREQRKVYVPGIGTFRLDQSSAQFNDDKTVITPPTLSLSFDDGDSEDNSLLKYILDTGLLTEAKAKKKIDQFTQSAFNKLLNVDSVVIDGLGKIVKRSNQDKVEFEPNVTDLTREFNDLTPLKLSPIARISEQTPVAAATEMSPKVEESGSYLLRILLLSTLLIILWFLGKYLFDSYNTNSEKPKTEVLDESTVNDDASDISRAADTMLEEKYNEIDELIDPSKEGTETKTDDEKNNSTEQKQEIKPVIDENEEDNQAASDIKAEVNTEESSSKSLESVGSVSAPINKHADIIPESGECIIIVGSFIKSLNAIKMVSKLERKGYTVFQSEYKGFTRVGLKYECADEDLENYLQNIRKKISKKAWYLDPDLVVPYQK